MPSTTRKYAAMIGYSIRLTSSRSMPWPPWSGPRRFACVARCDRSHRRRIPATRPNWSANAPRRERFAGLRGGVEDPAGGAAARRRAGAKARRRCWPPPALAVRAGLERREPVDRVRPVRLVRAQDRRREVRVVRGVGEVLRLERETVALAVLPARRAVQRAVEEVARVELQAGLR